MTGRRLRILGIRGIPAAHGGFETFAEHLALYLSAEHGWRVSVYCQEEGNGRTTTDEWQGVERIHIPVAQQGPLGTMVFDWRAIAHAARHPQDLCLTLGYNTAAFCARLRLRGVTNLINMDGIEWRRAKWGAGARTWFWLNEWAGCWLGQHLIADHPEIKAHLATRTRPSRITTIAYGADDVRAADPAPLREFGLEPGRYLTVVARPEPENSLLEIVDGYSRRPRGVPLIVLGKYDPANDYHRSVQAAAGPEVRFVGAIYDKAIVRALRAHALAYVHGHRVGGTNPSLVEALGAANPIVAHDNRFNRWVAGSDALYFSDAASFTSCLDELLDDAGALARMRDASRKRFEEEFTWDRILRAYRVLLEKWA